MSPSNRPTALDQLCVLIVEGDPPTAARLAGHIASFGCTVLGPISTVEAARDETRGGGTIDVAIINASLAGAPVNGPVSGPVNGPTNGQMDRVADDLARRGIPIILTPGSRAAHNDFSAAARLPEAWSEVELKTLLLKAALRKPEKAD